MLKNIRTFSKFLGRIGLPLSLSLSLLIACPQRCHKLSYLSAELFLNIFLLLKLNLFIKLRPVLMRFLTFQFIFNSFKLFIYILGLLNFALLLFLLNLVIHLWVKIIVVYCLEIIYNFRGTPISYFFKMTFTIFKYFNGLSFIVLRG